MARRRGRRRNWDEFSRYAKEREEATPALMLGIVNEAVQRLQVAVKLFTPVGPGIEDAHGGEKLIDSINTLPAHKDADARGYSGSVYSNHHAVMPVEYGSSPHLIQPNAGGKALKLENGRYASEVWHPGHRGAHMFQKGAAAFEAGELDDIADHHIREYLE